MVLLSEPLWSLGVDNWKSMIVSEPDCELQVISASKQKHSNAVGICSVSKLCPSFYGVMYWYNGSIFDVT